MVSLSSVSSTSQLMEPKEGVVGTSHLQSVGQKYKQPPGLAFGILSWRGSLEPLICSRLVRRTANSLGFATGIWCGGAGRGAV